VVRSKRGRCKALFLVNPASRRSSFFAMEIPFRCDLLVAPPLIRSLFITNRSA
jgi:hypothetical protein